jgi:hypothetical protein
MPQEERHHLIPEFGNDSAVVEMFVPPKLMLKFKCHCNSIKRRAL